VDAALNTAGQKSRDAREAQDEFFNASSRRIGPGERLWSRLRRGFWQGTGSAADGG